MLTRARGSAALVLGSAVSGLLAYVFFALVTRSLGAAAAAPVSVLWTYWSFAAAGVTFPVQHWIVRAVRAHGTESVVWQAFRPASTSVLVVAALSGAAAWLLRDPLFGSVGLVYPVLVLLVTIGSAFMGMVRGVLLARRRLVAVAIALVGENALRCLGAALLMAFSVQLAAAYAVALVSGQLVALAWPSTYGLGGGAETRRVEDGGEATEERTTWAGFLGGAGSAQLLSQAVLTGGPVVLALSGGSAAQVTALFAALALFRAPYTLTLGAIGPATGALTALVVQGRQRALVRIRLGILGVTVLGAAVALLLGALVGPALVRLVFGSDVVLSVTVSALVALGSALSLGNLALMVLVMARNRTSIAVRSWLLAVVAGGVVLVLVPLAGVGESVTTSWAFVAAEAAALAGLLAGDTLTRRISRSEDR
jgi:O-antigen/teichoic acid export membrane protein